MATVLVEKFVEGRYETSFKVPTSMLRLANRFLPGAALSALADRGLELQSILVAHARGETYTETFMVRERGVLKRIVVSLH